MHFSWLERSLLWLVLDRNAAAPRSLSEVTRLCVAGGTDVILCRIKGVPLPEVRELATEVRQTCHELGVPFVLSHYPELAAELEADGVHLGVGDPSIAEVKRIVNSAIAIGYSTHSVAEAKQCFQDGADYVFLGPIFKTPEKLKFGLPLGSETAEQSRSLPGPVVFIGGVNQRTLPELLTHGAGRIAVIGALHRAPDPAAAARALKHMLIAAFPGKR